MKINYYLAKILGIVHIRLHLINVKFVNQKFINQAVVIVKVCIEKKNINEFIRIKFLFVLGCAYKLGICSMCGVKILQTKNYRQSSV